VEEEAQFDTLFESKFITHIFLFKPFKNINIGKIHQEVIKTSYLAVSNVKYSGDTAK
jgi:hypothetical protein